MNYRMISSAPAQKVTAGAFAAALSAIVVWGLNKYAHADIDTVIGMAIQGVFTFVVQYLVPPSPEDTVVPAGEH